MFRTANPAWRNHAFDGRGAARGDRIHVDYSALGGAAGAGTDAAAYRGAQAGAIDAPAASVMTLSGAVNKTFILLCLCAGAAIFSWSLVLPGSAAGQAMAPPRVNPMLLAFGGAIVGLIIGLITSFKPRAAPFTAPLYALAQGIFVGAVSALYAARFGVTEAGALTPNYSLVFQAITLTFGVLGALLLAYTTRLIKPTENLKLGIVAATGGVRLLYVVSILMGFFGVSMPLLHSTGPLGIGVSVVIVIIAALNLVLDFDFIEQGAARGLPKYMEWYAGFGLLVTLVWLYLEILRLLSKIAASRD